MSRGRGQGSEEVGLRGSEAAPTPNYFDKMLAKQNVSVELPLLTAYELISNFSEEHQAKIKYEFALYEALGHDINLMPNESAASRLKTVMNNLVNRPLVFVQRELKDAECIVCSRDHRYVRHKGRQQTWLPKFGYNRSTRQGRRARMYVARSLLSSLVSGASWQYRTETLAICPECYDSEAGAAVCRIIERASPEMHDLRERKEDVKDYVSLFLLSKEMRCRSCSATFWDSAEKRSCGDNCVERNSGMIQGASPTAHVRTLTAMDGEKFWRVQERRQRALRPYLRELGHQVG